MLVKKNTYARAKRGRNLGKNYVFNYQGLHFWRYLSRLHNFMKFYFLKKFNFCRLSKPDSGNLVVLLEEIMNKTIASNSRESLEIF